MSVWTEHACEPTQEDAEYWRIPPHVCAACERGMEEPSQSGCCTYCQIEWSASHQLAWREPEAVGLLAILKKINPHFEAREAWLDHGHLHT